MSVNWLQHFDASPLLAAAPMTTGERWVTIILPVIMVIAAIWYLFYKVRRVTIEQISNRRLEIAMKGNVPEVVRPPSAKPFLVRLWYVPWIVALLATVSVYFALPKLNPIFLVVVFMVVAVLGVQIEAYWADTRRFIIEQQLASAIDLMVGSLQAGAGVLNAMDDAAKESPRALRSQLEEVVGRIRLGDEPQSVFQDLMTRVPLETFRLFSTALAVHWKVGGSLAPTLASVGRTIRNRIEVTRRTRSMTTQARLSIIMVLCLTYFISWMMFSVDEDRMMRFITSTAGPYLILGSVLMQILGIVWAMSLSRPKF